jgi:basic amino acid/polyamine antiporter, APA family
MAEEQEFKRSLGLLDGTMLVAGSMIGSGIFIVSAEMGRMVGSAWWLLALWLITGLITIFAALSYGELAGMMPNAGGQFVYIQRAWGNFMAFLYGWSVFTVIQTGLIAAVAVAFAKYMAYFIPAFSPDNILFSMGVFKVTAAQVVAIVSLIFLTFLNTRGIRNGKIIQLVFTSAKLLALFALIVLGLGIGVKTGLLGQNFASGWTAFKTVQAADGSFSTENLMGMGLVLALGTAIVGSLFSSDAWNSVTFIAGEMKNPRKNIPLSLLLGTLIVTALYILANLAYLSLLPLNGSPTATDDLGRGIMFAQADRVGAAAAFQIFGAAAAGLMSALIVVSTFGCNSGLILSGARVYYAMAKQGLFFKQAEKLNKFGVPEYALWVQCFWASLLCLSGSYGALLDYCTFVSLLSYILTIGGIFVLRRKFPNEERPYRVPFYPITPIVYILLASIICIILLYTKTQNTFLGLGIVALGIPFYFLRQKKTDDT